MSRLKTGSALQSQTGMSWWYRGALCGHPLPAIANIGPAVQHVSRCKHCDRTCLLLGWFVTLWFLDKDRLNVPHALSMLSLNAIFSVYSEQLLVSCPIHTADADATNCRVGVGGVNTIRTSDLISLTLVRYQIFYITLHTIRNYRVAHDDCRRYVD